MITGTFASQGHCALDSLFRPGRGSHHPAPALSSAAGGHGCGAGGVRACCRNADAPLECGRRRPPLKGRVVSRPKNTGFVRCFPQSGDAWVRASRAELKGALASLSRPFRPAQGRVLFQTRLLSQKIIFSPNWIWRAVVVVDVIRPAPVFRTMAPVAAFCWKSDVDGLPKFA
jgi:hypothetical protein